MKIEMVLCSPTFLKQNKTTIISQNRLVFPFSNSIQSVYSISPAAVRLYLNQNAYRQQLLIKTNRHNLDITAFFQPPYSIVPFITYSGCEYNFLDLILHELYQNDKTPALYHLFCVCLELHPRLVTRRSFDSLVDMLEQASWNIPNPYALWHYIWLSIIRLVPVVLTSSRICECLFWRFYYTSSNLINSVTNAVCRHGKDQLHFLRWMADHYSHHEFLMGLQS